MKAREGKKRAIFPSLIWGGGKGGLGFPFILSKIIKMEQQIPIPPKSKMNAREGQKRAIFSSLIWGGGGGV